MHIRYPHGLNLRKGRYSQFGQIYLVTTATYQRKPIFTDLFLGRILIGIMRWQNDQERVDSFAYVIMPDHLHWLFALSNQYSLQQIMKAVKGFSSYKIRKLLGETTQTTGQNQPLWQKGYHDHALRKEEDLKATARYIVANPLRAGLVESIGQYPLWDTVWL